jgi:hypothetical protein
MGTTGGDRALSLTVARNSDGRLHAFMIGLDSQVWQNDQQTPVLGAPWTGWSYLSQVGDHAQSLTVVPDSDGRLHAFMTGSALPKGPTAQGDTMQPGQVLNPGQSITSADGRFTFIYQTDGNLVLYLGGTPLWASGTNGLGTGTCIMQADGNLVIYSPGPNGVWASGTSSPGSRLVVQTDGNVVIYRPDGTAAWATNTAGLVSLRAHADNMIVTADNAGSSPLIANRTAIGQWEEFGLITNADGSVSFRALANNMIVTADNAGLSPLIANRTAIGQWEEFDLITNADGSVSFRAHANNMIVTADNAGTSPLIANRTAIGQWEEFDLIRY